MSLESLVLQYFENTMKSLDDSRFLSCANFLFGKGISTGSSLVKALVTSMNLELLHVSLSKGEGHSHPREHLIGQKSEEYSRVIFGLYF